jgi:hypothetical protein
MDDYAAWIMNYYRNPEPHRLFDAFDYGVHNKKVAKADGNTMIVVFFSSALRLDTILQRAFYQKIGNTRDEDFIYTFGLTLWQIHTDFSNKLLDEFLKQSNVKKYDAAFKELRAEKFVDIWTDPIIYPEHLDMLWTDFFATGNEESIRKIISKLSDLNSTDPFALAAAGSAQWSLTSNSFKHEKVLNVCIRESEIQDNSIIKAAIDEIVNSVNRRKGIKN